MRLLALRDELVGRDFDDPGAWWPEQPAAVGGRDRVAGGTWCASDVASGVTALVLNRPQRRLALPGAASRGTLPLLALQGRTPDRLDLSLMASFAVVLVGPEGLRLWEFDGSELTSRALGEGTWMVTSGGAEDAREAQHLASFRASGPDAWPGALEPPADDPAALVVRHELDDKVFATVFGQAIRQVPGSLEVSWSRMPWQRDGWDSRRWS